jgi:hypothetical protein
MVNPIRYIQDYLKIRKIARRNKEIKDEFMALLKEQGTLTDEQSYKYLVELDGLKQQLDEMEWSI